MRRAIALVLLLACTAAPASAQPIPPPAWASELLGPALNVSELDKSLKFYVDGLGMKVLMDMGPDNRHETMLGFGSAPRGTGLILLSDKTATTPPQITHGSGFGRLVMRVTLMDIVVARLRALGYTVSDPHAVVHGYCMAMATDPDGYKLELVESGGGACNGQ